MPELTPNALTAELLALVRDQPYPETGEHPMWRSQRWIHEDPERAWQVFGEVVWAAPDEPDVLESVRYNLQLLLYDIGTISSIVRSFWSDPARCSTASSGRRF